MEIGFSEFESVNFGIIFFLIGWRMNKHIPLFQEYTIPEPVTGGLLACLFVAVAHFAFGVDVDFNLKVRDWLLLYFFTAIGLNARLETLLAGGRALILLLAAALVFLFLQNTVGTMLAEALGLNRVMGLLAGSISLVGGHGTAIAWGPLFARDHGVANAAEVGSACATFGLILASLIGGPMAKYFIKKRGLTPDSKAELSVGMRRDDTDRPVNYLDVLRSFLALNAAMTLGWAANELLEEMGVMLPLFVPCLVAGIVLTNVLPRFLRSYPWPANTLSMGLIAEMSLGVFLSMSLMSLKIWTVADLAGPMLLILAAQTAISVAFGMLVIFPLMGRDYEAAVVTAGFGGISMGSTPTAIANMTAVSERFGPAPRAFIVVPLVCSFFLDVANAVILKFFL